MIHQIRETSAAISISGSTGQGGMCRCPQGRICPNNIQDIAEAVFVEIAQVSQRSGGTAQYGVLPFWRISPVYDIRGKSSP